MFDQDSIYLLLIVTMVIMVILLPPGPGTPLRDWARNAARSPSRG
jgi:hypothetical protein